MVTVGQVRGAYGVQGWVYIRSFTDPPSNLLHYQPWHLRLQGPAGKEPAWQVCSAESVESHRGGCIARFSGVADRDAAQRLSGTEIAVPEACLPVLDEGEFYWRELIGLRVVDQNGIELGVVWELMPTGAQDVMVIRSAGAPQGGGLKGGEEVLIPFVSAHVTDVRIQAGLIHVDWETPQ